MRRAPAKKARSYISWRRPEFKTGLGGIVLLWTKRSQIVVGQCANSGYQAHIHSLPLELGDEAMHMQTGQLVDTGRDMQIA